MTPGSADPIASKELEDRLESLDRSGGIRKRELEEAEDRTVAARVQEVFVQHAETETFLRVSTGRVHLSSVGFDQRLREERVTPPEEAPGLDVDLVRFLGVPGRDIPVPGAAFHLGQVTEELVPDEVPPSFLEPGQLLLKDVPRCVEMARPQELEPVAGPRRGVPGCLEPLVLRHREVLQPHRLVHAVFRRTTQQELDHAEGGHGVASDREVGDPTCMLGRGLRVLRRVDQIAAVDAHPCQVFEDRRGERGFASRLLQRLLAQSLDAGQVQPTDRCQLEEDAGPVGTGLPVRDRFLQQLEGTSGVARIEVIDGGIDAAPEDACGILGRRDLPGQLGELGGGVGSSPCGGVPRRRVERLRHLPIGSTCREGEVSRPLLRVEDDVRQAAMEAPSGLRRGCGVDGRSEERVCELDPLAAAFDDVRLFGFADPGQGSIPIVASLRGPGRRWAGWPPRRRASRRPRSTEAR